jgi:general stress protein 26
MKNYHISQIIAGHHQKLLTILLIGLLAVSNDTIAQNYRGQDSTDKKILEVAKTVIGQAGICAFISVDQEGRPRARMVETLPLDSNFIFWFGTNPRSRKVQQIQNNHHVSLYYTEPYSTGYVLVEGIASLVNDSLSKATHWKDGWQTFYPDKKHDFVLIKVIPDWIEVVSYTSGIVGDQETWEPPRVIFHTDKP